MKKHTSSKNAFVSSLNRMYKKAKMALGRYLVATYKRSYKLEAAFLALFVTTILTTMATAFIVACSDNMPIPGIAWNLAFLSGILCAGLMFLSCTIRELYEAYPEYRRRK